MRRQTSTENIGFLLLQPSEKLECDCPKVKKFQLDTVRKQDYALRDSKLISTVLALRLCDAGDVCWFNGSVEPCISFSSHYLDASVQREQAA